MTLYLKVFKKLRINLSLKLILGCCITLIAALTVSFYIIAKKQEKLIISQIENEARTIFQQIIITRKWIADHNGVFVEQLPWTKPNPYLKDFELIDKQGKKYLKRNPAMVTRELSEYAKKHGLYWFHITSLNLLNPENAPDQFERNALHQFENSNIKEVISIETIDNSKYLRYISPLYVEDECLKCHINQGYKVGDIRGAISITIPMDKTYNMISSNRKSMFLAGSITLLSLISALYFLIKTVILNPMNQLMSSIKAFSSGEYSPKNMLKTNDEFEDLCKSFSEMANKLTEYHSSLKNKIREATLELEETNKKLMQANNILNEMNMRKSDFIASASHELRTPLTSIKGAMDYIAARLNSFSYNDENKKSEINDLLTFFEIIKKNSDRLIRMVNDMLDIEQIEMGTSDMLFLNVDLSKIISEEVSNFLVDCEKRGIKLKKELENSLLVHADEDRIRQVIINLLSNAIKFSPDNSEIIIRTYRDQKNPEYSVVEVCDKGVGVPFEDQEKIFEKFYKRGGRTGTGLGLAICKSIIEVHKGKIGVISDGKNGSCFYFKLPCLINFN